MEYFAPVLIVLAIACLGAAGGCWLAGPGRRHYWPGVALALLLVVYLAAVWWDGRCAVIPFTTGLVAGRGKLALLALAAPLLQVALLTRLKKRSERMLVGLFLSLVILRVAVLPLAMAGIEAPDLMTITNRIDPVGVCLQTRGYTCGPAAAVTLLRKLGIDANEGELAVLAGTNSISGTDIETLAGAINQRYGAQGVHAESRYFRSIDEMPRLPRSGYTLAVVKVDLTQDHCIAILGIDDQKVLTGDPASGKRAVRRDYFARQWRYCGIVIQRTPGTPGTAVPGTPGTAPLQAPEPNPGHHAT